MSRGTTAPNPQQKIVVGAGEQKAQVTIEFSLCFILGLLLFWGCIMAIRWAGVSLAERRIAHDETLLTPVDDHWDGTVAGSPLKQLEPDFFDGAQMNLIFKD